MTERDQERAAIVAWIDRNRGRLSLYAAVIICAVLERFGARGFGFFVLAMWALMLAKTVDELRGEHLSTESEESHD